MRSPYLLALLLGIRDHSLRVCVLADQRTPLVGCLLLARSGLAEHVELEDDISVIRANHRGVLSLLEGLGLNCARKKTVFNL